MQAEGVIEANNAGEGGEDSDDDGFDDKAWDIIRHQTPYGTAKNFRLANLIMKLDHTPRESMIRLTSLKTIEGLKEKVLDELKAEKNGGLDLDLEKDVA
eukprot:2316283-Prymnesium_polylepis.1